MSKEYKAKLASAIHSRNCYQTLIDNEEKCGENRNEQMIIGYRYAVDGLDREIHNYKYNKQVKE